MGNCECGRLKGNPCGPLRLNTINVTMPFRGWYEVDFLGFSYGVRPGRNPHQTLAALHTDTGP